MFFSNLVSRTLHVKFKVLFDFITPMQAPFLNEENFQQKTLLDKSVSEIVCFKKKAC